MFSKYDAYHPFFPFEESKQCENIVCNDKSFCIKNLNFYKIFDKKNLSPEENWAAIVP